MSPLNPFAVSASCADPPAQAQDREEVSYLPRKKVKHFKDRQSDIGCRRRR